MSEYCSIPELHSLGINAKAIARFTEDEKRAAIRAASSEADTYMQAVVGVPLALPYPDAVKVHVARMATFNLLNATGFNRDGDDKIIEDNYDRAIRFFTAVSKGVVALGPTVTPPIDNPADDLEGPVVSSDPQRGYPEGYI